MSGQYRYSANLVNFYVKGIVLLKTNWLLPDSLFVKPVINYCYGFVVEAVTLPLSATVR